MFFNARNGNINIGNTEMDYISFGNGMKNLIIIPGLGDALKTVKGTAIALALLYRIFAKDYSVYVFSRKNKLENGYSTKEMAADLATAMIKLSISNAHVFGISQGGMIAQYLAVDYPELVEKLVLAVTVSRPNDTLQCVVNNWIALANKNDYKSIFIDTVEKSYSEKRLRAYRPLYPLLSKLSKPKSLDRFIIQANACLNHNAYNEISEIRCPTLVIGGEDDKIVGKETAKEVAQRIIGSKLKIYKGLGHGAYEEASDFNRQILDFLNS